MGELMTALINYLDSDNAKDPGSMMRDPARARRMAMIRVNGRIRQGIIATTRVTMISTDTPMAGQI